MNVPNLRDEVLKVLVDYENSTPAVDIGDGLGNWHMKVGDIADKFGEDVRSQGIGNILRNHLGLLLKRTRYGYQVCWNVGDLEKIAARLYWEPQKDQRKPWIVDGDGSARNKKVRVMANRFEIGVHGDLMLINEDENGEEFVWSAIAAGEWRSVYLEPCERVNP